MEANANDSNKNKKPKRKRRGSSLLAATIARSATAQASRHDTSALANTGTNISYEGPTAPGAGGSAGTGYASGKEAVDEKISTNSDYEQNRGGSPSKARQQDDDADEYEDPDKSA